MKGSARTGLAAAFVVATALAAAWYSCNRPDTVTTIPRPPNSANEVSSTAATAEGERGVEAASFIAAERAVTRGSEGNAAVAGTGVLLPDGHRLAIQVTSPSGAPVRGAIVRLYPKEFRAPKEFRELQPSLLRAASAVIETTDERGEAVWRNGVVADTLVLVDAPGFAPCSGTVTAEEIVAGSSAFRLTVAASIMAKVVDGVTSRPLAGVTAIACPVVLHDRIAAGAIDVTFAALEAARGTTDAEGRVTVGGVAEGVERAVWLFADGYPPRCVSPLYAVAVEQVVRLYGGSRVVGRVIDELGEPLAGALVVARVVGVTPDHAVCRGTTIDDGTFAFDAVPPTALEWIVRKIGFGVLDRYAFESHGTQPLEFVLAQQATCSGLVVDDQGTPIPAARLVFIVMQTTGPVGNYETHDDGSFDMPWVAHGTTLMIRASAAGHRSRELSGVVPTTGMRIVLPRDGSLCGRVRDAAGAPVTAFRIGWRATSMDLVKESESDGSMPWLDCSSADGIFNLPSVTADEIEVEVDAPGFGRPAPRLARVPPGGACDLLEFELPVALTVSGRIVGPTGSPILGATVSWLLESFAGEPVGRKSPTTSNTDNDGRFVLRGMPESPFTLRVTDNVHPNAFYSDLTAAEFPCDIVYGASSILEGRIALPWSSPECAVMLTGRREGTQTYSSIPVDSTGHYRWGPIPAGRWMIELYDQWTERSAVAWYVRQIETVDIAPGETKRVDFDVRWPGRVLGNVRSSLNGELAQRLEARLFSVDEAGRATKLTHVGSCYADGTFGLCSIPLGRYRLQIISLIRGHGAFAEQFVELTAAAPTARLTLELANATLSGRVVDGDSHPLVADVRVVREADGSLAYTTRSDRDGSYRLAPLEGEAFRLVVSAPGYAEDRTDPIDPDEVDRAPLEHVLEPEARLFVRVRDDAGAPLASVDLELVDANAASAATGSATRWTGRTAIDGTVTATRLPAGSLLLRCRHADWPAVTPTQIDLEWGETRTQELTLTRFGRATVLVVDAAGLPLSEVVVTLNRDGDPASTRAITTDAAGAAEADRLSAGRWRASCERTEPVAFDVMPGAEAEVTLTRSE